MPAPPSWLPAPAPAATLKARAVSVPRHVVQGSRVVPPPVRISVWENDVFFNVFLVSAINIHFPERLAKIWANAEVSRYPPGVVLQAYSPGARVQIAVVQRQVSSPNLSPKPTSFVVPAPSPGRPVSAMNRMNIE